MLYECWGLMLWGTLEKGLICDNRHMFLDRNVGSGLAPDVLNDSIRISGFVHVDT